MCISVISEEGKIEEQNKKNGTKIFQKSILHKIFSLFTSFQQFTKQCKKRLKSNFLS